MPITSSQETGENYIMKRMRWVGQAACIRMNKNAHGDLVRKSEGKRPLGTPKHRWGNHIIDLKPYGMVC
jgi:hypothetical protein